MDLNSSYRFAARVGAFVKLTEDGRRVYHDMLCCFNLELEGKGISVFD
jgi:hypothetical protein